MAESEARKWRKRLRRELSAQQEAEYKRRLADIDAQIEAEKRARADALAEAKIACEAKYTKVKAEADAAWTTARLLATAARRAKKQSVREWCAIEREHVRAEARAKIEARARRRQEERSLRKEILRAERTIAKRARKKRSSAEAKSESDEEVEGNLPLELVPLWQKVRGSIKATARASRTEAFLKYAEEHPDEAIEAQESSLSDAGFAAEAEEHYRRRR